MRFVVAFAILTAIGGTLAITVTSMVEAQVLEQFQAINDAFEQTLTKIR